MIRVYYQRLGRGTQISVASSNFLKFNPGSELKIYPQFSLELSQEGERGH